MKKHIFKPMFVLSTLFLLMCLSFALVSASTSFKSGSSGGLSVVTPPPTTFPQSKSVTSATLGACPTVCGDAFLLDGLVTTVDMLHIYHSIIGVVPPLAGASAACGDVNQDKVIDMADVTLLGQHLALGTPISC